MTKLRKTNNDIIKQWNRGDVVPTIEMGGLGPNYELIIQSSVFKILTYLTKNKIPKRILIKGKKYSEWYNRLCDKLLRSRGHSGASFGASKNLAFNFHYYGHAETIEKATKDRVIMVIKEK